MEAFPTNITILSGGLIAAAGAAAALVARNKLLGPVRNQLALFATVPEAVVFVGARALGSEILRNIGASGEPAMK